ncbi:Uu.00g072720.m01.CDS01 [Anthostomella pinea]|uniref:Uu.00g072720.m01.CDS01 n=1 Tax=Anthostomella pinea TaxID=933095 RepID=A0AAI8VV51_9PEZI|nr:Uu.00g072720.m01.CDS01 [Anthostomella pinea]
MGSFPGFLYKQITFKPKPPPQSVKLHGLTALVTGGNAGLGLEACKELAAHGVARIVLGVRSTAKGDDARKEILALHSGVDVQVWELDHESFDSVRKFADRAAALDRLDIAILSAGVKSMEFSRSRAGHESNVQVRRPRSVALPSSPYVYRFESTWPGHHLGTALLSLLLLGPLKATATAKASKTRLTIVSSETHFWAKLSEVTTPNTFESMDKKESFGKGMDRYNASKLLNVLWMRELSTRAGGNVIINAVNPGFCQSTLHRSDPSGSSFANLIGWTARQGGHCLTATAPTSANRP